MLLILLLVRGLLVALFSVPARAFCKNGTARLHGGIHYYIGRAQICVSGHWLDICGEPWGRFESSVLCNQLGYSQTDGCFTDNQHVSKFNDTLIASTNCQEDDPNISECRITKIDRSRCNGGPVTVYCRAAPAFHAFNENLLFWRLVQLGEISLVIIGFTVWLFKKCWKCCCCKCCPCRKDEGDEWEERRERHYKHERHQMRTNEEHRNRQRQYVRTNHGFQQGAVVQNVY